MASSPTCGMGLPCGSWWTPPTGMPGCRQPRPSPFAVSMVASLHTKSVQATGVGDCTGAPIARGTASCTAPTWASRRNSRSSGCSRWQWCWRAREQGRPRSTGPAWEQELDRLLTLPPERGLIGGEPQKHRDHTKRPARHHGWPASRCHSRPWSVANRRCG